jgi:hypothetical protein
MLHQLRLDFTNGEASAVVHLWDYESIEPRRLSLSGTRQWMPSVFNTSSHDF